ncbi:hypothetical protein [Sphingobium sp. CAP-1]|uniref:hypothetical protein n=1 Tax=Sphingobium sp. CAP-1 TaxID=2676077 RepID=UPI0012BB44F6|nr:hypothetical protein [Sphingobium sp. CAP-1]QGP78117.1 hypothetical protein GL174_03230 [Sphingobium sp. CAP-1]
MSDDSSDHHFALTVNIAVEALKSLLIVNGGAATALIALTDKKASGSNFGLSILLFGLAALFNAVTLVVGYFSQLSYSNHRLSYEQNDMLESEKCIRRHQFYQNVAIALIVGSLIASAAGMAWAFKSL